MNDYQHSEAFEEVLQVSEHLWEAGELQAQPLVIPPPPPILPELDEEDQLQHLAATVLEDMWENGLLQGVIAAGGEQNMVFENDNLNEVFDNGYSTFRDQLKAEINNLDEVYELHHWPDNAVNWLMDPKKHRAARFNLFLFLVGNGVGSELAEFLVLWWHIRTPPGQFTRRDNAREHVREMREEWSDGGGRYVQRWLRYWYFDMEEGRPQTMAGQ